MRLEIPMDEVKNVEYDGTDLNSLDFGDCRWRKPYYLSLPPHPFGTPVESLIPATYTINRQRIEDNMGDDTEYIVGEDSVGAVFRYGDTITYRDVKQILDVYTPVVINLINCNPVGVGGEPSVQVSGGQPRTFTIVGSNYNTYYEVSSISSGSHTLGSSVVLTLSPKRQNPDMDYYSAKRLVFYNADTNQEIGRINAEYSRETEFDKWWYVGQYWEQNGGHNTDTFTFNYVSINTIFGIPFVDNVKVKVIYSATGWHTLWTGVRAKWNIFTAHTYSVNDSKTQTFSASDFGLQSFKYANARINGMCPDGDNVFTNLVLTLNTEVSMPDTEVWYVDGFSNKCSNSLTFSYQNGIIFKSTVKQVKDTVNDITLQPASAIQKLQQYFEDTTGEYE